MSDFFLFPHGNVRSSSTLWELPIHGNHRMQHMPCYYQRTDYISYKSFTNSMFLKQEMVTQWK